MADSCKNCPWRNADPKQLAEAMKQIRTRLKVMEDGLDAINSRVTRQEIGGPVQTPEFSDDDIPF